MRDSLWNINQIAEKLGVNYFRVRYVLQTRKEIQPVIDTSRAKLYDAKGIAKIKAELKAIEARRSSHQHANPVGFGAAANPVSSV